MAEGVKREIHPDPLAIAECGDEIRERPGNLSVFRTIKSWPRDRRHAASRPLDPFQGEGLFHVVRFVVDIREAKQINTRRGEKLRGGIVGAMRMRARERVIAVSVSRDEEDRRRSIRLGRVKMGLRAADADKIFVHKRPFRQ